MCSIWEAAGPVGNVLTTVDATPLRESPSFSEDQTSIHGR